MVDQDTPYGALNYNQTGTWADGTPRFASKVTLSPDQQRNLDQQSQFDTLVNQLGIDQTKRLTGHLDKPIQLGNEATEARLFDLGSRRLNPEFDLKRAQLDTSLRNQGFNPGDEGYATEMKRLGQQQNDAMDQLLLTGRGQANQELLTERNQPINEITALMSGGQVSQPNFTSTPTASVGSPDVGGMTYKSYELGPLAGWQNQQQSNQALMGGLFSLGGAALGGWARGGFGAGK